MRIGLLFMCFIVACFVALYTFIYRRRLEKLIKKTDNAIYSTKEEINYKLLNRFAPEFELIVPTDNSAAWFIQQSQPSYEFISLSLISSVLGEF